MPITFGSVGDIIATVQITTQLLKALSTSQGSSKEFREVVDELKTFQRALEQLLLFLQTRSQCALLDALKKFLPLITDCRQTIASFQDEIFLKYDKSLGEATSRRLAFKKNGKMLHWHVFEREKVATLRAKISRAMGTITMIQGFAQLIGHEEDKDLITQRFDDMNSLQVQISAQLDTRFNEIVGKMEERGTMLNRIYGSVENVIITTIPIVTNTLDIRDRVTGIYQEMMTLTKLVATLSPYSQQPAILEDALGYPLKIPLEIVRSWETVNSILCDQFQNRAGWNIVQNHRYLIQDHLTGSILRRDIPFNHAIRPGQKLLMTMVFYSKYETDNICPRCKTMTVAASNLDVRCSNSECGMVYGRITDITDIEQPGIIPAKAGRQGNRDSEETDDEIEYDMAIGDIAIGDTVPAKLAKLCGLKRTEDSPEVFKRVRFITRWEDFEESRGDMIWSSGGISCWKNSGPASDPASKILTSVSDYWCDDSPKIMPPKLVLVAGMFFVGPNRQHSVPVIIVYARYEEGSRWAIRRARKCMRLKKCYLPVILSFNRLFRLGLKGSSIGYYRMDLRNLETITTMKA
ncbi:hypothetical protein B7494_g3320 [Chlorociboria aeruginascens]|nr:hypothetical protein B7494_g3320 [Chlorociboria aeruginascens]